MTHFIIILVQQAVNEPMQLTVFIFSYDEKSHEL